MAPSPRKQASLPFDQTWHETNATTFDPASLPLAKIPRAWERKEEKKRTRDGKEKKVWRRYTLRSQPGEPDDDEPRELDARNRVVKKLRVGAEGLQPTKGKPKANKRALVKGTRYDRRKSVLPRKKAAPVYSLEEEDNIDTAAELSLAEDEEENDTASEADADYGLQDMAAQGSQQNGEVADSGFTFTVEEIAISTTDSGTFGDDRLEENTVPAGPLESLPEENMFEAVDNTGHQEGAEELTVIGADSSNDSSSQSPDLADAPSDSKTAEDANQEPNIHQTSDVENLNTTRDLILEDPVGVSAHSSTDHSSDPMTEQETIEDGMQTTVNHRHLDTEMMTVNLDSFTDMMRVEVSREIETPLDTEMMTVNLDLLTDIMQAEPSREAEIHSTPGVEMCEDLVGTGEISPTKLPTHRVDCELAEDVPDSQAVDNNVAEEPQLDVMDDDEVDVEELPQDDPTVTEASLQLELLEEIHAAQSDAGIETSDAATPDCGIESDISRANQNRSTIHSMESACPSEDTGPLVNDITDGLTLGRALTPFVQSANPALQSSSLAPAESSTYNAYADDATMTIALDDDTALLKDFLTRAAANKANKAANIVRRTSLQNRRDSGAIRSALASPRKVLEDKDPNSPSKFDNDVTLDLSQTLTLNVELEPPSSPSADQQGPESTEDTKPVKNSRRSTRMRTTRLPHPATTLQLQTPKISVRRTDGNEHVVLKKSEAQETSRLTTANTRKNKQGAFPVGLKLLTLASEAAMASGIDEASAALGRDPKKKNVRWDAKLAYFQDETTTLASVMEAVAEAESLATPDELSGSLSEATAKSKSKASKERSSTPRARKVRNLGASNGTPGKGLLAPSSLLPADVQEEKEEKEAAPKRNIPRASKAKKMPISSTPADPPLAITPTSLPLPSLETEPAGMEPPPKEVKIPKERKSRLATPKRVKLPQPTVVAAPIDGKENQLARGIAAATPKKGLPMPQVGIPVVAPVVESGLPRRRAGRKL